MPGGNSRFGSLALLAVLVGAINLAANGQPAAWDVNAAIRSSLTEVLSLATLGALTAQDGAAEVNRVGADYQVTLPVNGFSRPAEAIVHQLEGGVWDVLSLKLPSSGTFKSPDGRRIEFAIGEQSMHAQVDPGFSHASTYAGNFGRVSMRTNQGDLTADQTLDRYSVNGTVSAERAGRLDLVAQGKVIDWHLTTHGGGTGDAINGLVREISGRASVGGLNRVQAVQMAAVARTGLARGWPSDPSERRDAFRTLIDAASGLFSSFRAEETLVGIRFGFGPDRGGSIERLRFEANGDASDERVGLRMQIGFDELALSALPADTAVLLPHHFSFQSVVAGLQSASVIALLRAATDADADPDALRDQVVALLGDPNASVRIESVTFDCGPMRVAGSAKIVPLADGQTGAEVHVSATGLDALIALGQHTQALQQFMPMLAVAKGKGHQVGDNIVWDFTFGL